MTAPAPRDQLRDGCPHCGDRAAVTVAHVQRCERLHDARRANLELADMAGETPLSRAALDDLFAHLTTPRPYGQWCAPETAAHVIRCAVNLGWRPVVGGSHE